MGICTSLGSNKKRKNSNIRANEIPNKNKNTNTENEITSTRPPNKNQREKILGKIDEKELKRNNTVTSSFNKRLNNSNIQNIQSSSQFIENMNSENNPITLKEKMSENKLSEKKGKERNILGSKEENTNASLESKLNNNNINNEKNSPEQKFNNIDNNSNNNVNAIDKNNENINEEKQEEKEIKKSINENESDKKIEIQKAEEQKEKISEKELENKKTNEKIYEDNNNINNGESFITFLEDFNKSNIYDNKSDFPKPKRITYNNNYYLFKGNLFNLNNNINSIQELNESSTNSDSNKIKDGLYYFSEFHFTQKKYYSTEKDFNNLLNSQIFQNKIILTNKLLNLQERQWYKESISLSDSLKINRENTYLDSSSFSLYLNKIINLYNHFNWLTWAVSYYYFNSLLFNKNHWFNL